MKTKILVTVALMAGMMLAGCSKEESENMEENKQQTYQYDYFEEPILDFSLSLEQLKAKETHAFASENEWEPSQSERAGGFPNPWLIRYNYTNQEIPTEVCYTFPDKDKEGIFQIVLLINKKQKDTDEKILKQLAERYGAYSMPDDSHYMFAPYDKDFTINFGGYYIIYTHKE